MVRFSCFPTPIHYHRSKKSIKRSVEAIENKVQDSSPDLAPTLSGSSYGSNPLKLKANDNNPSSAERMTSSSSFECCLKSEEMNSSFSPIDDREVLQKGGLKKSQSLGSGLDKEGKVPCGVGIEDEIDQGLYHGGDHEKSFNRIFDHSQFSKPFDVNKSQATVLGESFHIAAGLLPNESIFSIGYPRKMDTEVQEDSGTHLSAENSGDSAHGNPGTTDRMSRIGKSCSLPNFGNYSAIPQEGFMGPRCTSFRDLRTLDIRRDFVNSKDELHSGVTLDVPSCYNVSQTSHLSGKGLVYQEVSGEDCVLSNPSGGSYEVTDLERDHAFQNGKNAYENNFGDGNDSFNFPGLAKGWTLSEIEEVDVVGSSNVQQESSVHRLDKLPSKEFNMKRIEDWISNIDIQAGCSFQELGESSDSILKAKKDPTVIGGVTAAKFDPRVTLGMEVANNSLSLLTAVSTSAQMANLGLAVIPFLSAFISLRVLNLSGNAIVRITAGALPRGLHTLNLSKNNISAIEGLRELTRLRVLDLSYNRIFRIGHGLASCSSLKELYLAGNKISEVEGLHRLLKLNVLDLRFNKISTAKSLGQLAANYSSLQAINLEGNPAQRNVGDDQIKKYLLSLLPHLVYFNRQTIRSSSSSKEVAERPARSITAYQHDRGLRSEHKLSRRGNHGSSTHKPASSSSHGRPSQWSRAQHGRRPPTMTMTRGGEHQLNIGIRQLDLPSSSSMRRSRSEGTL